MDYEGDEVGEEGFTTESTEDTEKNRVLGLETGAQRGLCGGGGLL